MPQLDVMFFLIDADRQDNPHAGIIDVVDFTPWTSPVLPRDGDEFFFNAPRDNEPHGMWWLIPWQVYKTVWHQKHNDNQHFSVEIYCRASELHEPRVREALQRIRTEAS